MSDTAGRVVTLALVLACATGTSRAAGARLADHVVLISVDGLLPEYCTRPEDYGLALPNLSALRRSGSWADGVIGVYPSLTYPSHTTLVTGVRPARHGVVSNTRFEPPAGPGGWYFESAAIRVPTLWQVVAEGGFKTAGVSWPVTVGSSIAVLFPETRQFPDETSWLELARRQSSPGLIDAVVRELGGFGADDNRDPVLRDRFAAAAASYILRSERPALLLVHLVETDYRQHASGRHSREAKRAFENVDAHVGAIVEAAEQAGVRQRTAFVVTGDHGFRSVRRSIQPNWALREAGLVETDAEGGISDWRALAHRAAIRLRDPGDPALARRVETLFRELARRHPGVFRVVGREQLDRLGSDPGALLMLEPSEGYRVSDRFDGDAFVVPTERRGDHGYLPDEPDLHTGLILSGAGVRRGVSLPLVAMVDIAPTAARLLGLSMPGAEGAARHEFLLDAGTAGRDLDDDR